MNVVWFAEIKWDYLRTRKQQLIARRPDGIDVLFFEPYARTRPNHYHLREVDGIRAVTIPFVKSVPGGPARALLERRMARRCVDAAATGRVKNALRTAGIDPAHSIFVISNVYAVRVACAFPRVRLIYDCNDAHSEFPGAPEWTRDYQVETFRRADAVVVSSRGLLEDARTVRGGDAGIHLLGNGVDFAAFNAAAREPAPGDEGVRVGYVGAIAPWFDFDLVASLARRQPTWRIVLVGPVLGGVEGDVAALAALPNVEVHPAVAHADVPGILAGFTVGIIPFRRTPLTAGVNPNKLYEYLAVGLPLAATPFSPDVEPVPDLVALAGEEGAFSEACARLAAARQDAARSAAARARAFDLARNHDWNAIAGRFWSAATEGARSA